MAFEFAVVCLACLAALAFRPWEMLRDAALRRAWGITLLLLPWIWCAGALMPAALALQFSGAALLVLMFGWPLAVLTCALVALLAAIPAGQGLLHALESATWYGVLPATLALGLGVATRRWLPQHLMVYILARGFGATLAAMTISSALWVLTHPAPPGLSLDALMVGRWLMAWGDAMATGMAVAVFVAYRPQWLATYADRLYLPR